MGMCARHHHLPALCQLDLLRSRRGAEGGGAGDPDEEVSPVLDQTRLCGGHRPGPGQVVSAVF